jgi:hypothetical protein
VLKTAWVIVGAFLKLIVDRVQLHKPIAKFDHPFKMKKMLGQASEVRVNFTSQTY